MGPRLSRFDALASLLLMAFGACQMPWACAQESRQDPPKPVARLEGASGRSVEFISDGRFILTSGNRSARVWDAATFKPVAPAMEHGLELRMAIASPDGRIVATVGGHDVNLWDRDSGKLLRVLRHDDGVVAATFSPDGTRILTSGFDATAWSVGRGERLMKLRHDAVVGFAAYSHDGGKIVTLSELDRNGAAIVWDAKTGRRLAGPLSEAHFHWANTRNISPAAFDPGAGKLATIGFQTVEVWDASDGTRLASPLVWHDGDASSLVFSNDGSKLLVGRQTGIDVFDTKSWKKLKQIDDDLPIGPVEFVSFARNDHWIVGSSCYDGSGIWDYETGKKILAVAPPDPPHEFGNFNSIPAVAVNPDCTLFAAGWMKGNYTAVWNVLKSGRVVRE